ncbi:protein kinase rio1 [Saitozyma podzolica]|uniref:Serine/threonine-protein kinase RIO1 n=1 Tax=Saitozyma podzolica TaxID=1890683 RepID=A0A427YII4_9TREE|nr:protein kinase rio1 [Saitozyma podzolica]
MPAAIDPSSSRPDGLGFIDEPDLSGPVAGPSRSPSPTLSGSSIEEESEDEEVLENKQSAVSRRTVDDTSRELLAAFDDVRLQGAEVHHEDEDEDWDVEDEDWELADGDFTKQYNRLRQHHAAVAVGSASRQAVPLPARNVHHTQNAPSKKLLAPGTRSGGVAANPKSDNSRPTKDKADRATTEQVLDARTRLVLSGLVNRGVIGKVEHCVSTGKETAPNHPVLPDPFPTALAVKIYRTSILHFRSRQDYIVGEHRFRGEYSSSRNPRKMVRVWAEKELRNLRRLNQEGIRAPRVVDGKENVLVMEYLGTEDGAAPRLKDADVSEARLPRLYAELLVAIRRLYHHCHLVHADLSEYNLLYHLSHLYIIDVSQSVEHDHPHAFEFLRSDLRNVDEFFTKRSGAARHGGRRTARGREGPEGEERLIEVVRNWLEADETVDAGDDAVFMSSYIPRNLGEVYDPERDVDLLNEGRGGQLIYAGLTGLDGGPAVGAVTAADAMSDGSSDDDASSDSGDSARGATERNRGFRHEDRDAKKERKKAVKEEKREKRKQKMPKAQKQKLVKRSAGK